MEEMSNESWEALNNTVFVAKEIRKVLGLVVQMTRMVTWDCRRWLWRWLGLIHQNMKLMTRV